MTNPGGIQTYDGVALAVRGDTLTTVWKSPARLHRTRWFFDAADELSARSPAGVLALMIILPTADPPDGPARAENARRLRALGPSVRRLVTVVVGDDLWQSIVRTMMRVMFLPHDGARRLVLERTIEDGVTRLLESAGPATPSFADIDQDVRAAYAALDLAPPSHDDPGPPLKRSSGIRWRASPVGSRIWDELTPRGPRRKVL
jgi:hypothetical protein